jgi:hypothetical protein
MERGDTVTNLLGNVALAEQLLAEARPLMARRAALLLASDALRATATLGAAIQLVREQDGPPDITNEACGIITALRQARRTP